MPNWKSHKRTWIFPISSQSLCAAWGKNTEFLCRKDQDRLINQGLQFLKLKPTYGKNLITILSQWRFFQRKRPAIELSKSLLSKRGFSLYLAWEGIVLYCSRFSRPKAYIQDRTSLLNYLQELAHGIRDEHYTLGIPQSRVYRRFQPPISMPFPCRSGKQTSRLTHVMILQ
jgi:hypothetical protein